MARKHRGTRHVRGAVVCSGMVCKMRKRTVLFAIGTLLFLGVVAGALTVALTSQPAWALNQKEGVRITAASLNRLPDGTCYVSISWDKKAGRPRYYLLERESPPVMASNGVLMPGALTVTAPQKLSRQQIRDGQLILGPLRSAEIERCRVALAAALRGSKAGWVWSSFLH